MRHHKNKRGRRHRSHHRSGNGMYRSRNGVFLGICRGFAEYYDIQVFWVRLGMVLLFMLSGFWPMLGIYLVAALFLKPKPVQPINDDDEREFYHSYVNSPRSAAQRLKKKFSDLDRRIRRMEDHVTGKDYEWERKFYS
jgi:phage shock protein C